MKLVFHPPSHFIFLLTYLQLLQEAPVKKDFGNNLNSDLQVRESESSDRKARNLDFKKFILQSLRDAPKLSYKCFHNREVKSFREDKNGFFIVLQSMDIS